MKRFMINRLYAAYKALKEPEAYLNRTGLGMIPGLAMKACMDEGVRIGTQYHMECVRPDGSLRWATDFHNLVTDVGIDHLIHKMFNIDSTIPAFNTASSTIGNESSTYGGRRTPRPWKLSTAVKIGDICQPTIDPAVNAGLGKWNQFAYIVTGGTLTTAATEPTWPTTLGGTVTETSGPIWYRNDWYIGLISGTGTPTLAVADVMGSHTGWSEESTNYSETTRRPFDPNTSTTDLSGPEGRQLTNSSVVASFTMTGTNILVEGAFMTNFPLKGDNTNGLLYGAGTFAERNTQINDVLNVTVTLTVTN